MNPVPAPPPPAGLVDHPTVSDRLAEFAIAAAAAPGSVFIARDRAVRGAESGPLAGRLFAVKDNIDAAGYPTTAACPAFAYRPDRSATVVERLLEAGATLVGKTNLDQFACGLVGVRSPYGAVPNAFDPAYISGGSSSGSAVAVALGLVDFALGTDTAGSGRVPAGFNNIVGLKPSRGLLSARGVVPACQHLDCVSIFARTVPEAVAVLLAAAGPDPGDPYSRAVTLDAAFMPSAFRFAVPDHRQLQFCGDRLAQEAFAAALDRLQALGGRGHEIDYAPLRAAASALYDQAWVAERYAGIRAFYERAAEACHPVVRAIIESGRNYPAADLFAAMTRLGEQRQYAAALWDEADVLVVPTAPTIYRIAEVEADPVAKNRNLGTYTNFVNLLDLAAIAVPSSIRPDGLPFGITLIGPAGSELRLADLAQRYHVATGLAQGALNRPVPDAGALARPVGSTVRIAVVGAHLDGLPLNVQLRDRGAQCVARTRTAPLYRFYALAGTQPPKPGLVRVRENGCAIAAEVWELPMAQFGGLVALVPAPLSIGTVLLEDGSSVQGFLCEAAAVADARDISALGGWRAYLASLEDAA